MNLNILSQSGKLRNSKKLIFGELIKLSISIWRHLEGLWKKKLSLGKQKRKRLKTKKEETNKKNMETIDIELYMFLYIKLYI